MSVKPAKNILRTKREKALLASMDGKTRDAVRVHGGKKLRQFFFGEIEFLLIHLFLTIVAGVAIGLLTGQPIIGCAMQSLGSLLIIKHYFAPYQKVRTFRATLKHPETEPELVLPATNQILARYWDQRVALGTIYDERLSEIYLLDAYCQANPDSTLGQEKLAAHLAAFDEIILEVGLLHHRELEKQDLLTLEQQRREKVLANAINDEALKYLAPETSLEEAHNEIARLKELRRTWDETEQLRAVSES